MHCFVFLQGPHGPFFAQLAKMLRHAGARCIRVGFNRGDQAFWSTMSDYIAFRHDHSAWPETFERILTEHHVTDLVLYGDTRNSRASHRNCQSPRDQNSCIRRRILAPLLGDIRTQWIKRAFALNGYHLARDARCPETFRSRSSPAPIHHFGDSSFIFEKILWGNWPHSCGQGGKAPNCRIASDPKPIVSKYATRQVRRVALQPTETEARRANDQSASARLTHDLLRQQQRLR